jgi:hypothetical protein
LAEQVGALGVVASAPAVRLGPWDCPRGDAGASIKLKGASLGMSDERF